MDKWMESCRLETHAEDSCFSCCLQLHEFFQLAMNKTPWLKLRLIVVIVFPIEITIVKDQLNAAIWKYALFQTGGRNSIVL